MSLMSTVSAVVAPNAVAGGDPYFIPLMVLMFGVMYFVVIRPQANKQKEQQKMWDGLSRGDEVLVSGIYGKITEIKDQVVVLELSRGVTIQVQKGAITTLLPKGTIGS